MSFTRRSRLVVAESFRKPAWDVLPLAAHAACLEVLSRAAVTFGPGPAVEGAGLFLSLSDKRTACMQLTRALRKEVAS